MQEAGHTFKAINRVNSQKPILIFNTGKVKDANACKDQEKLKHEYLQFYRELEDEYRQLFLNLI